MKSQRMLASRSARPSPPSKTISRRNRRMPDLRAALVQLLCLSGNWTRANAQLEILAGAETDSSTDHRCC
ncbi:hypothetical protein M8494_06160 [Serratia ureilytica]